MLLSLLTIAILSSLSMHGAAECPYCARRGHTCEYCAERELCLVSQNKVTKNGFSKQLVSFKKMLGGKRNNKCFQHLRYLSPDKKEGYVEEDNDDETLEPKIFHKYEQAVDGRYYLAAGLYAIKEDREGVTVIDPVADPLTALAHYQS